MPGPPSRSSTRTIRFHENRSRPPREGTPLKPTACSRFLASRPAHSTPSSITRNIAALRCRHPFALSIGVPGTQRVQRQKAIICSISPMSMTGAARGRVELSCEAPDRMQVLLLGLAHHGLHNAIEPGHGARMGITIACLETCGTERCESLPARSAASGSQSLRVCASRTGP